MKVRLRKGGSATAIQIADLEAQLGASLPESYKAFVAKYDGAKPDTNIFAVGDGNESGVNRFIELSRVESEKGHVENLSKEAFPVAWAEGGNYVVMDLAQGGAVFFWDHEAPAHLQTLASDFEGFLSLIAPFDVDSIELRPGQVKSAWIDPEFLKHIENGEENG